MERRVPRAKARAARMGGGCDNDVVAVLDAADCIVFGEEEDDSGWRIWLHMELVPPPSNAFMLFDLVAFGMDDDAAGDGED
mmetsp:Transcript_13218/g.22651  ORF Transcript_13218/g.22651 Transcript_13218/m.22651 type:complete len:81 (+) Transcript_13218:1-243(+)